MAATPLSFSLPFTLDLSGQPPPLVAKVFAIEQHIDQVCVEHSEYKKSVTILNRVKNAITSSEQQIKQAVSKQKRLDLANAKRMKVEENHKIRAEEESAKKALGEANQALET